MYYVCLTDTVIYKEYLIAYHWNTFDNILKILITSRLHGFHHLTRTGNMLYMISGLRICYVHCIMSVGRVSKYYINTRYKYLIIIWVKTLCLQHPSLSILTTCLWQELALMNQWHWKNQLVYVRNWLHIITYYIISVFMLHTYGHQLYINYLLSVTHPHSKICTG